ncbi:hypothetical protein FS749_008548 [Ceratobasidium sp. UAMH 11750]|nr:hypothetical protein FS749_008548 [Ceratobasidium sp. UAMH 11750]
MLVQEFLHDDPLPEAIALDPIMHIPIAGVIDVVAPNEQQQPHVLPQPLLLGSLTGLQQVVQARG